LKVASDASICWFSYVWDIYDEAFVST